MSSDFTASISNGVWTITNLSFGMKFVKILFVQWQISTNIVVHVFMTKKRNRFLSLVQLWSPSTCVQVWKHMNAEIFFCVNHIWEVKALKQFRRVGATLCNFTEKRGLPSQGIRICIFRKTIFYHITKPNFVNFGCFLPRLSGNEHSQV